MSIACLYQLLTLHRPVTVTLMDHRQRSQEHLSSSSDVVPSKPTSDASTDGLAQTVKEKLFIETHSNPSHFVQDRGSTDGGDGEVLSSHSYSLVSSTSASSTSASSTSASSTSASNTSTSVHVPEDTQVDCGGRDVQLGRQKVQDAASSTSLKSKPHSATSAKEKSTWHHAPSSQGDNPILHAYRVLSEWCQPETCRLLGEGWSERDASQLSYSEADLIERQQKDRIVQYNAHTDDSSQPRGSIQEAQHLPVRLHLHVY